MKASDFLSIFCDSDILLSDQKSVFSSKFWFLINFLWFWYTPVWSKVCFLIKISDFWWRFLILINFLWFWCTPIWFLIKISDFWSKLSDSDQAPSDQKSDFLSNFLISDQSSAILICPDKMSHFWSKFIIIREPVLIKLDQGDSDQFFRSGRLWSNF
jgi:hypothetical protein